VLVGLACKNAILIVEFAKDENEKLHDPIAAVLAACKLRLRPILMTSIAFIMGVWPLVSSHGAGAEMRRAMGVAVFSGMIGVTFLRPLVDAGVLHGAAAQRAARRAQATTPPAPHGPTPSTHLPNAA